jgi:hypothetical protein
MNSKTIWLVAIAVVPALLCLLGYWALEWVHFNVRILVVLFWCAILGSLVALASVRRERLSPFAAALASWLILWPAAEATLAWSAWWLNGFAP